MLNFVFISPAFPGNYENFCIALKANGVNVLGIGDTPYEALSGRLKSVLTEYYKVNCMEDYEEMYRAVAFLAFHHGKIDWLESNNEYWLEQDARLREDFHITTGLQPKNMAQIKYKSKMKACYQKAGVPTARYHMVSDLKGAREFIQKVGYPVIVKPDSGVGASDTWKIQNEQDLKSFFCNLPSVQYIMEEFVPGEICSYDAIINSRGTPLFETGNITPISIMDCVNEHQSICFYIVDRLADDLKKHGRACVQAFHVRSRFIHLEFFRLLQDHSHLGKKGQIVALEANMRPSGGPTPDMVNYAYSTNCYQHYADMVVYDRLKHRTKSTPCFCAYIGRWKELPYLHTHSDILNRYQTSLKEFQELPEVLAHGMGNFMYLAKLETKEALKDFFDYTLQLAPSKEIVLEESPKTSSDPITAKEATKICKSKKSDGSVKD